MTRRQLFLLVLGVVLFASTLHFLPWQQIDTVYEVVPVQNGTLVSMGHTNRVVKRTLSFRGYAGWWQPPKAETVWFGTKVTVSPCWLLLCVEWVVLGGVLALIVRWTRPHPDDPIVGVPVYQ
jgi:hypothetical protein